MAIRNRKQKKGKLKTYSSWLCLFFRLFLPLLLPVLLGTACSNESKRIALWSSGAQDGNFEFDFCQKELDLKENVVTEAVHEADFRTSFLFASTDSYDLVSMLDFIGVDKEAKLSSFDSNGVENKGDVKAEDFFKIEEGKISSDALSLFGTIGVAATSAVWSFTDDAGTYHSENCMDAKNNSSDENGRALRGDNISESSIQCSARSTVICISK